MIRFTVARQPTFAAAFTVALASARAVQPSLRIPVPKGTGLGPASTNDCTLEREVNAA